jgi:hypothetical protein
MVTFLYLYTCRYLVSRDSGSGRAPDWRRPLTIRCAELCGITGPTSILPYLLWESATIRKLLTDSVRGEGEEEDGETGRRGDGETGRRGDGGTGERGNGGTGERGNC